MYEFYVTITGARQGRFKGETTDERHQGKLVGLAYEQASAVAGAPSSRPAGKAAVGKVTHQPVRFTKQWGAASPQLLEALVTGEVLKTVVFEFISTNEMGEQAVFHRVTLFDARVTELRPFIDLDAEPSSLMPLPPLEEVALAFTGIRVENLTHQTSAQAGAVKAARAVAAKPRTAARTRARG
jgi:type VI secretion system secreted protein Hcp